MGYRSDIYVAMTKRDYKQIKDAMHEHDLLNYAEVSQYVNRAEDPIIKVIIRFTDLKWYEGPGGFEDVNMFMDLMRATENYQYVRIGEDPADVDEDGEGDVPRWDPLRVSVYCEVAVEEHPYKEDDDGSEVRDDK